MSITTSNTRLSRTQAAQMPALLEFYSPSAGLLEAREKGPARGVIWVVMALVLSCFAAAALIPVDKVVSAAGRVVATESTVVIQPLETSIVREIDVDEGQVVHKGQLLARLDPTFSQSDKIAMGDQAASLHAEVERLQAEAAGVEYRPSIANQAAMVQETIFAQRRAERLSKIEDYRQKVDGLQAQLAKSLGDIQAYSNRSQVAATVEDKRKELQKLGWGSQLNSLAAQDQHLEIERSLDNARNQAKSAATDLLAMRAEAAGDQQTWKSQVSMDLADAQRKLADMNGSLQKADLRNKLVEIRADMDATVLTRAQVSVGSVLQSGDQFFTLVPIGAPLEVQATISADDAGFVHVGDKVDIKFDTFPYVRYGSADGTVRVVSPDSFVSDPNGPVAPPTLNSAALPVTPGKSFYRASITLDKINLHDTPPGFHVTPGMPTTADVMVGKRTVLTYIFSRALPVAMDGMREP